jgi:hypothetical protein
MGLRKDTMLSALAWENIKAWLSRHEAAGVPGRAAPAPPMLTRRSPPSAAKPPPAVQFTPWMKAVVRAVAHADGAVVAEGTHGRGEPAVKSPLALVRPEHAAVEDDEAAHRRGHDVGRM